MAFNWQTFRTRALTAIIFAIVMLAGLLWNKWSFLILFSFIHFGCWWEYFKLTEKIYNIPFHIYVKLGFMLLGYGLMLWLCGPGFQINGYGISQNFSLPFTLAGFVFVVMGIFQKNRVEWTSFAMAGLGIFYISLSWGLMMALYDFMEPGSMQVLPHVGAISKGAASLPHPWFLPVFIIACMWINDTMAYIVGSMIGKTPLSKISPKKTWEGTIGGAILCAVVVGWSTYHLNNGPGLLRTALWWISFALLAAIIGTLGDLLESKLKRMAAVKDSGNIMPGHGGFLDRFDSLLIALPACWIFLYLFA